MLNILWAAMIILGTVYAAVTGHLPDITDAALSSGKEAVTLSITMMGVISLWSGIMEIASESGILTGMAEKMRPLLYFLFPDIPKEHPSLKHIAANMIANIFGLGWAATPAGLKAMEELENLEENRRERKIPGTVRKKGVASNEMCNFLIINISSLQLIPVNIIAYRSQYGSADPAAILGPAVLATMISTATAVIFCKIMDRKRKP
ncbi:MAG: nucleoside recognition protein [Ruminococcus sp.]|jgi:spore maturation protein A